MQMHPNVIHQDEEPWMEMVQGKAFQCRRKALGKATQAQKLGCSLFEVPPGASAWPYHYHCANEEAIYVLDGEGTLRLGETQVALRTGHFVALPPGKQCAHRLVNSSDRPLRYLCFSTMAEPEVSIYPDSKKFGVMVGAAPGGAKEKRTFSATFRLASEVPYLEDEPDA